MRFSQAALAIGSEYRARSYFIFSYDRTSLDEMDKGEALKAPDEVKIEGGPWGLRSTLVSARIHYASPWEIDVEDGELVLRADGGTVARVSYPGKPWYYGMAFEDGQLYAELVPVVGWSARMFSTVQRACGFWGDKEECHFCDINANLRALRRQGHNYTPSKDPARVAAVIKNMLDKRPAEEPEIDCIILSGGTNLDRANNRIIDKGFYVDVVRAVSDAVARGVAHWYTVERAARRTGARRAPVR